MNSNPGARPKAPRLGYMRAVRKRVVGMRPMDRTNRESGATGKIDAGDGGRRTRGDFEWLTVYVFRSCLFIRDAICGTPPLKG